MLLSLTSFARESIIVSSYPLYYPASYMAGDRFEVDVLIRSQADPHHYELKPEDVRRLQRAKAFVYLGAESWERRLARSLPKGRAYQLFDRLSDPHLWMSPKSYTLLVKRVYEVLLQIDPSGAEHYRRRYEEFASKLASLDEEYRKTLSTCRSKTLVTTHLSTAYLGKDYGLEVVGLRGVHAEEEPRPSEVLKLVQRLKRAQVKVIFAEMGHDEKLARRIAQQVGARVTPINTSLFPEEKGDDYFSIMRRNLKRIAEALECQTR